jgi:small subunit ribosomal protein S4e
LNLETGDVESLIKYENGAQVLIIGGNNIGRVGILQHVEKHPSSFDIAHIKDS